MEKDFRQVLSKISNMQKQCPESLAADCFFLGYNYGISNQSAERIQLSFEVINKLNDYLANNKLDLEDKLQLYHLSIDLNQEIEFLAIMQHGKQQQQFSQKSQILMSSLKQSVFMGTNCTICTDEMKLNDIQALSNCPHVFHKKCMTEYVQYQNKLPIKCPEVSCQSELRMDDLKQVCSQEMLDKLDQFSFNNYLLQNGNNLFKCPTPNCQMVVETDQERYDCLVCKQSYCTKCKKIFHPGVCGEQSFIQVARQQQFKLCNNCKAWVEKNLGCNHMTCRCGYEFCYVCGDQWNGQGKCRKCNKAYGAIRRIQEIFGL